jgi:predicted flap endonuclease-1-like 5' DNA nuclease
VPARVPRDFLVGNAARSTSDGDALERVNGIGDAYATRLRDARVPDLDALAEADADDLAERTDLPAERIKDWMSQARNLTD